MKKNTELSRVFSAEKKLAEDLKGKNLQRN